MKRVRNFKWYKENIEIVDFNSFLFVISNRISQTVIKAKHRLTLIRCANRHHCLCPTMSGEK